MMMFRHTALLLVALALVSPASRLAIAQEVQRPRTTTAAASNGVSGGRQRAAHSSLNYRTEYEQIVRQPALDAGFFAVKIVSLETGAVIFEQDSRKLVPPGIEHEDLHRRCGVR